MEIVGESAGTSEPAGMWGPRSSRSLDIVHLETTTQATAGRQLCVVICGGGIAGLATTARLREDHDITDIEQSRLNKELSAAIILAMNATKILISNWQERALVLNMFHSQQVEPDFGRRFGNYDV